MKKNKLIIILGPTATGKSDLAVEIALKINGEIISADSRQVYRGLDIGSGKITTPEMKGIPHHLIDVIDIEGVMTADQWKNLAIQKIHDIVSKNKVPIICGGTGFYISHLLGEIKVENVPPNNELRAELEKLDNSELFKKLEVLNPEISLKIDKDNKRKLIRAIEIAEFKKSNVLKIDSSNSDTATYSGKKENVNKSIEKQDFISTFDIIKIGLDIPTEELRDKINIRLKSRLDGGMIEEVQGLLSSGASKERLFSLGLEYRYTTEYLLGVIDDKVKLFDILSAKIWQYARRQRIWWKRDKKIKWFNPMDINSKKEIFDLVLN